MKDNFSLIAAAAGGFMLSMAAAGIIRATPVTSVTAKPPLSSTPVAHSPLKSTQVAPLQLKPVHPDESAEFTLNQRFSLENSQESLKHLKAALTSFRTLTERSKPALGEKVTAEVGNTDWETQNLGFTNWVNSVEGTLEKQDYQLRKLEFELAKKQYEDKQITQAVLDEKAAAYQRSEQEFQKFWNSFAVSD